VYNSSEEEEEGEEEEEEEEGGDEGVGGVDSMSISSTTDENDDGGRGGGGREGGRGRGITGLGLYEKIFRKFRRHLVNWPDPSLSIPPEEHGSSSSSSSSSSTTLPPSRPRPRPRPPSPSLQPSSLVEETLWGGDVPRPWGFRLRLVKPGGVDCGRCGWKEVGREGRREGSRNFGAICLYSHSASLPPSLPPSLP
jgi:hypothetical protein